eukprot:7156420-Alexandrium_andersonii.AAC.1
MPIGTFWGSPPPTGCNRPDRCNGPARAERAVRAQPWQAHCTSPSDRIPSEVMCPDGHRSPYSACVKLKREAFRGSR